MSPSSPLDQYREPASELTQEVRTFTAHKLQAVLNRVLFHQGDIVELCDAGEEAQKGV